ncbi:MAG: hypothetical protein AAFU64_04940 [Bacteroidota bacterium]
MRLLFFVLLVLAEPVGAQSDSLLILTRIGQVQVDGQAFHKRSSNFLGAHQTLGLGEASYLSLIHPNGHHLEIWKRGSYSTDSLMALLKDPPNAFSGHRQIGERNRETLQKAQGPMTAGHPPALKVFASREINYILEPQGFTLQWCHPGNRSKKYRARLENIYLEKLDSLEVSDTCLFLSNRQVDVLKAALDSSDSFFIISIENRGEGYGEVVRKAFSMDTLKNRKAKLDLQKLEKQFAGSSSLYLDLAKVLYLEKQAYHPEALRMLNQMLEKYPDDSVFQHLFFIYLMRYQIMEYWELKKMYPQDW